MSIPGTVQITGLMAPTDTADTYPVTSPEYQVGGAREVADYAARNAIPALRRSQGMHVYVQEDGTSWQLSFPGPWTFLDVDWERTDMVVQLQDGVVIATRPGINFIAGPGITLAAADNAGFDVVDLTIASTAIEPTAEQVTYDNTASGLPSDNVQAAIDSLNALVTTSFSGDKLTRLVSGGGVTWVSGYTFTASAASYYIFGVLYTSAQQTVTLDASDPTDDRYDVLFLDATGTLGVLKGVASTEPVIPVSDPQTQLALTSVYVAANSSSPPIVNTLVYDEGIGLPSEWTASQSGTAFVLNSTTNPFSGTVDINGTGVAANAWVQFQAPSSFDVSLQDSLVFSIRSKGTWNKKSLVIGWQLNGTLHGSTAALADGAFGFSSSNTTSYQQIVIPISHFNVPGGTVNQLRMTVVGSGAAIGFYLDAISFQAGGGSGAGGLTQDQADARYCRRALNLSDIAAPNTALNNILPAQTGNAKKTLVSDGSNTSWDTGYSLHPYVWALGVGSNLVVGTDKTPWARLLRSASLTDWAITAKTPCTGASVILDILRCPAGSSPGTPTNWVSIFSASPDHRPTLTPTSYISTGTSFDVNAVTGATALAQGDLLRMDIVQVGSIIAGKDLAVELTVLHHN